MSVELVVVDASALVDLFVAPELGPVVESRVEGRVLHAPAHVDGEVLSALGRLHRSGHLPAAQVTRHLRTMARAPIERHELAGLLTGAWKRRDRVRLADALYVELAATLGVPLVTTDSRLARAVPLAELVASREG